MILLGHLEPARLLNIEREAIWERVWFIHGHQHDNIDSSAQWDAQGFQSFGVGLRGVMAVNGLD